MHVFNITWKENQFKIVVKAGGTVMTFIDASRWPCCLKGRSTKAILDIHVNSRYSTKEVVVHKLFQDIILKEVFRGIFLYYFRYYIPWSVNLNFVTRFCVCSRLLNLPESLLLHDSMVPPWHSVTIIQQEYAFDWYKERLYRKSKYI